MNIVSHIKINAETRPVSDEVWAILYPIEDAIRNLRLGDSFTVTFSRGRDAQTDPDDYLVAREVKVETKVIHAIEDK